MGIAYEDDIDKAMAAIHAVAASDDRTLADPAPMVAVWELADSSAVNLTWCVFRCDNANYWALKFDLIKALKERFDSEGISIPYPQRQVHLNTIDVAGIPANSN